MKADYLTMKGINDGLKVGTLPRRTIYTFL